MLAKVYSIARKIADLNKIDLDKFTNNTLHEYKIIIII